MAQSKKQKAAIAEKKLAEARALLAEAEVNAVAAGVLTLPQIEAPVLGVGHHRHTDTVWVVCKLPRGLIIQLTEQVIMDRPTFGGGLKPMTMHMRVGEQVRLKGYAIPYGKIPNYPIIGDFGMTEVKREFWEKWLSQNKNFEPVLKGLIYAHGEQNSASAYAQEHEKLKCGLEPMNPEGDKRAEPVNSPNLTDIKTADDKAA